MQRCAECGSEQVYWRVHRTGSRQLRHSDRQLLWACRGCGHEWSESIAPEADDPPTMPLPA